MFARPRYVASLCMSRGGVLGGGAVVLDVAQLEALLTRAFSIGLDVGAGHPAAPISCSRSAPASSTTNSLATSTAGTQASAGHWTPMTLAA